MKYYRFEDAYKTNKAKAVIDYGIPLLLETLRWRKAEHKIPQILEDLEKLVFEYAADHGLPSNSWEIIQNGPLEIDEAEEVQTVIEEKVQVKNYDAAKQPSCISFLQINDEKLNIKDRILYSWLFWRNVGLQKSDRKWKQPTIRYIKKTLGIHNSTLNQTIKKLIALNYIGKDWQPLSTEHHGYWRVELGRPAHIVRQVIKKRKNGGYVTRAAWATKALGVSRSTFIRSLKRERVSN